MTNHSSQRDQSILTGTAQGAALFQFLFDTLPDQIYYMDLNGRLLGANPACCAHHGKPIEEMIGKTAVQLYPGKTGHHLHDEEQEIIRTGKVLRERERHVRTDGAVIYLESVKCPLRDENGKINGLAGMSRDITEQVLREDQLAQARHEAEQANKAKSTFLAMMSHEIRTPMNGVIGAAGLLLDTELTPRQKELTRTIEVSGEALISIINDILDYSRIEAGKIHLDNEPFLLRRCIEDAFDLFIPVAARKQIELLYEIDTDVPPALCGDGSRLRQILINLLGNAIKFTDEGEIGLHVSLAKALSSGTSCCRIQFSVRDTGIGIPEAYKKNLFNAFSQADLSTTRKYGGTGLGLTICQRLTELMDGKIWFESEEGKGSCFFFTISLPIAESISEKSLPLPVDELAGKKALLVDDNQTNLRLLAEQLERWGVLSRAFDDPQSALEHLKRGSDYDVALIDFHMPHMNGAELARNIAASPVGGSLPLLILTSACEPLPEGTPIHASMTKPVKRDLLLKELLQALAVGPDASSPPESAKSAPPPKNQLAILVAEDNAVNRRIVQMMLEKLECSDVRLTENGEEVVQAFNERPADLILMDIQMPRMNGNQAARSTAAHSGTQCRRAPGGAGRGARRGNGRLSFQAAADRASSRGTAHHSMPRMKPSDLPVYALHDALLDAWASESRLIIEAPTGSGKSTQIPQMLLDSGLIDGEIVVLQPRRLAARMLARRVARERGCELGTEVGYQVRFDRCASASTRIRYVTEGILLRQLLGDPHLRGIDAILFDEFHERHLDGDISLARVQSLQSLRPDLKIVVMSATLDAALLCGALAPCRTLRCEGRLYPVEIQYAPRRIDFRSTPVWDAAADAVESALQVAPEGDVLVFMPGRHEILRTVEAVRSRPAARNLAVLPLHGELSTREQDAAVEPSAVRKVVVATNVAETSITIDGIRTVIDSGLARMARYDARRGIETLLVERISRAAADQRAGRAGRTAPGLCIRLWTRQEHAARNAQEIPEILRKDLSEAVLMLKASGIANPATLPWVQPPDPDAMQRALNLLADLGALDAAGTLTSTGERMVSFPMHPRYARLLLAANEADCVRQACLIAALVQGRPLLRRRTGKEIRERRDDLFGDGDRSDFQRLMRAWSFADRNRYAPSSCQPLGIDANAARQARPLYERFLHMAEQQGLRINQAASEESALQKCILAAFSDHLARRRDRGTLRCELVHGRTGELARDSIVRDADLLTAAEITEVGSGRGSSTVLLDIATAVEEEWLADLFPGEVQEKRCARYDDALKRVVVEHRVCFRDLTLRQSITQNPTPQEAAEVLAAEVLGGRLDLPGWNDEVEHWILRANLLAEWCPDLGLPAIDDSMRRALIEQLCLGAVCRKDLRHVDVRSTVRGCLTTQQQRWVEEQVPERMRLPSGHRARIRYQPGHKPVLPALIQDLFGMRETPRVAFGRVPLVIELLAPNHRPVQTTDDLPSFWRTAYPALRTSLSRRYPKHKWPTDP